VGSSGLNPGFDAALLIAFAAEAAARSMLLDGVESVRWLLDVVLIVAM